MRRAFRRQGPPSFVLQRDGREVGGQPFSPVALVIVNVDKVPEPLVEDLVTQGGLRNEGKPDNVPAEQGKGGHGITRGKYIFDDGESLVRIGAEHLSVEFQVSFCLFNVRSRQFCIRLKEIGKNIHVRESVLF